MRCSRNNMAVLKAAILRLRGRAAAWNHMDGVSLGDKHLGNGTVKGVQQPLFCEWMDRVRRSLEGKSNSMVFRLSRA